jgi:hypothetical protein
MNDDLKIPSFLLVANRDKPLPAKLRREMQQKIKTRTNVEPISPPPLFDTLPRNIQMVVPRSIDAVGLAMFEEMNMSRQEKTAQRISKLKESLADKPKKEKRPKTNIIKRVIAAMREPNGVSADEMRKRLVSEYPDRTATGMVSTARRKFKRYATRLVKDKKRGMVFFIGNKLSDDDGKKYAALAKNGKADIKRGGGVYEFHNDGVMLISIDPPDGWRMGNGKKKS